MTKDQARTLLVSAFVLGAIVLITIGANAVTGWAYFALAPLIVIAYALSLGDTQGPRRPLSWKTVLVGLVGTLLVTVVCLGMIVLGVLMIFGATSENCSYEGGFICSGGQAVGPLLIVGAPALFVAWGIWAVRRLSR